MTLYDVSEWRGVGSENDLEARGTESSLISITKISEFYLTSK